MATLSSPASESFAPFVARSLDTVAAENPRAYQDLCALLLPCALRLHVDGETLRTARDRYQRKSMPVISPSKIRVVIFGAGIAGMTAAHELIERGFDVTLVDKEKDEVLEDVPGCVPIRCGGMAVTQWSYSPRGPQAPADVPLARTYSSAQMDLNLKVQFQPGTDTPTSPDAPQTAAAFIRETLQRQFGLRRPTVIAVGHDSQGALGRAEIRAALVMAALLDKGLDADWMASERDLSAGDYVDFWLYSYVFPGEHGFRFFPSFYRNLFDTMKRTPLPNWIDPWDAVEQGRLPIGGRGEYEKRATAYD